MYPYGPSTSQEYNPYSYNQNGYAEPPGLFNYPTHPLPTYAIESVTDQFTNLSIGSPSEMQFAQMADACCYILWLRKMGHTDEATRFIKAFADDLIKQKIDEHGAAHKLLFSLFEHFSDPLKGLYYLYLIALYTLPLQSASDFSAAFTQNGVFELQMRLQNSPRSLYFPHPFDCTIDPLTQEELSLVNVWLSYFMQIGTFTTDPAVFEAFLKAKLPENCPFRCAFECEKALFSKESPSYDLYFDLNPLANLNQFDIARICAQFNLRGQIGFDRHEQALQQKMSASDVAWAFIQDSMELAPLAIKQIAPKLVQELNDGEVLFKWIMHALRTDKELARILLNHASILTAKMKTILLLKLYSEQDNSLFDIAIYATLLEGMLEHAIAHSSLKNAAIVMHQKFFPILAAYSPKEAQVTSLAITLLCKDIDTTHAFVKSIHNLAQSVLEALDLPELALEGSEVLLWHPDWHFTSAIYKSVIDSHIQDVSLLPWKNRFFEIAIEIMHTLLDGAPGSAQENSIRLDIVAKMIRAIATGNSRQIDLVPIFEKMTFSPLSNYYGAVYAENHRWFQQLYPILKQYFHLYPKSAYKIELIASHTEWEGSSVLTPEEKFSLFNEVLDFQIGTKLPFALQRMCETMTGISTRGAVFVNNDDMKIAALSKIIDASLTMPYERALTTLHSDNGPAQFLQTNKLLLQCAIDCMLTGDTSTKKYPLVEKLATGLITFLSMQEDHKLITEFATLTFTLLSRAATNNIFESQDQLLELLRLCLTTPVLQKTLTTTSWETLLAGTTLSSHRRGPT